MHDRSSSHSLHPTLPACPELPLKEFCTFFVQGDYDQATKRGWDGGVSPLRYRASIISRGF